MKNLCVVTILAIAIAMSSSQSRAQSFNDVFRSSITVDTETGFGTTGTKVRTWANATSGPGKAITYRPDAVNGDSFHINQSGLYSVTFSSAPGTNNEFSGISVNGDPTVGIIELPRANRLCAGS